MEYDIKYGAVVQDSKVVDLAIAKENSNIQYDDRDTYLQLLLDAAVDDAERYIDSPLLERQMAISLSCWTTNLILPIFPIQSLTDVKYIDADGTEQTLDAASYRHEKDTNELIFLPDSLPDLETNNSFPVKISCVAGYKNTEMPSTVKSAVLLRFSHKELFPEDMPTSYNRSFQASLRPLKRWS